MKLNAGKIALWVVGISVIVIGLLLLLERPPSAEGLDPEQLLKRGWLSYRETDAFGSMQVSIFRDGKLVRSEELPSPLLPHLRNNLGNEKIAQRYEFLNFLVNRDRFGEGFLSTHDIRIAGSEKIAGRWAWDVEIKPQDHESGYISVAIDHETGFPLRRTKYDRHGNKENQIKYISIDHFERKIPPDTMRPGQMGQGPGSDGPMGNGHQKPDQPPRPGGRQFIGGGFGIGDRIRGNRPDGKPGLAGAFRAIPKDEFHKMLRDGKALYPVYLPDGYRMIGARKPGPPGLHPGERIQMVFSDGVNVLSIFQIKLPEKHLAGSDIERVLEQKTEQLHNTFPEGFAMRRVDAGLLVGVGDLDPELIERVLDGMDYFKNGQEPYQYEDIPEDSENLL